MDKQNYLVYQFEDEDIDDLHRDGYSLEEGKYYNIVKTYGKLVSSIYDFKEAMSIASSIRNGFVWDGKNWIN